MKDLTWDDTWPEIQMADFEKCLEKSVAEGEAGIEVLMAYCEKYGPDALVDDFWLLSWWEKMSESPDGHELLVAGHRVKGGSGVSCGEILPPWDGPRDDGFNTSWDELEKEVANAASMVPALSVRTIPGEPVDAADDAAVMLCAMGFVTRPVKLPLCRKCGLPSRYCGSCGNAGRLDAGLWPVFIMRDTLDVTDVLVCAEPGFNFEKFYKWHRIGSRARKWAAGRGLGY